MIARLFVVSPLLVIYLFHETHHGMLHDRVSVGRWAAFSSVCLLVVWIWDALRKPPRTLPSVILMRMLITSMALFSCLLLLGSGWYFWFVLSHSIVWMLVWLQLLVHRFAHHFVYPHDPTGTYFLVRQSGWHPFWDRLPRIFNRDSELTRNGGRQEPTYSDFVPPSNWSFQCPRCGSRVQHQIDVCWNCNYGAAS